MNSKIKISFLILTCFTLMGCPAGHFHDYENVGKVVNNENIVNIEVGYYFQYIDEKENGLSAIIETNPNFDKNAEELIKEVKSSTFGVLSKTNSEYKAIERRNAENKIIYNLIFAHRNERKTLKRIKNDTISIEFTNGEKSLFIRKTE